MLQLKESQEITVSEVGSGEALYQRGHIISGNLADSLEKGYEIVEILTDACLLEKTNDGLAVKMQKVIRGSYTKISCHGQEITRCQSTEI